MTKTGGETSEARINAILALLALWMGAWAVSLWAFFLRDAPQPGIGNLEVALGWQAIAGLLGLASFGISYNLPASHGVRRVAAVPLGMALFVALGGAIYATGLI